MKIAVLSCPAEEERHRSESLSMLLSRRAQHLVLELAGLGHRVHHVQVGAPRARSCRARASTAPSALQHTRATSSSTTPGRELSELVAAHPEVVLGIGASAGQTLELLAEGLRCAWVWAPGPGAPAEPTLPATAARILAQSEHEGSELLCRGLDPEMCDVVPWRLAADVEGPRSAADVPLRSRTALAVADPSHDGIADTVRALSLLPEHRLVVAVDARRSSKERHDSRWMGLAARLGVAERIRVAPVDSATGLRALLYDAGLLISVPRTAFQRELVATAMWCGTAVVASDLVGARELVETGCSGLVLPPGDPRRLARAVSMVTTDARGRGLWAWSARRRIRDLAGPEVTTRAVVDALERAASRPATVQTVGSASVLRAETG